MGDTRDGRDRNGREDNEQREDGLEYEDEAGDRREKHAVEAADRALSDDE